MQKVFTMNEYNVPVKRPTLWCLFWKRTFDIVGSLAVMVLLLPLALVVAIVCAIDTKSSPIFVQVRSGRNGVPFKMYKFRTMSKDAPAEVATYKLNNADDYISPVGKLIRRLSLDEIPQIVNILKGDMSFVGPRPVICAEKELLRLRRRNGADTVRPGLTGLAQISGRDDVPVRRKAFLDGQYVDNMCLWEDLKILAKTVVQVLTSDGIRDGANPNIEADIDIPDTPKAVDVKVDVQVDVKEESA